MTEAEKLFNKATMRCFDRWGFILSFRVASALGTEGARKNIEAEKVRFLEELLREPGYDRIFVDKDAFFKDNPPEKLVQVFTEATLAQAQVAVDAASIVFAHSVLDSAALDFCRVTALVAPRDWESVVDQRPIKLSDVRGLSYEEALRKKLDEFFEQFERESLLKKADSLLARCRPPEKWSPMRDYVFDRERLERLDRYRHEVIHGEGLVRGVAAAEGEVEYLMKTALFFMGLANLRYGLMLDPFYAFTGRELPQVPVAPAVKGAEPAPGTAADVVQREKPKGSE
jgi:hypothetical protein